VSSGCLSPPFSPAWLRTNFYGCSEAVGELALLSGAVERALFLSLDEIFPPPLQLNAVFLPFSHVGRRPAKSGLFSFVLDFFSSLHKERPFFF